MVSSVSKELPGEQVQVPRHEWLLYDQDLLANAAQPALSEQPSEAQVWPSRSGDCRQQRQAVHARGHELEDARGRGHRVQRRVAQLLHRRPGHRFTGHPRTGVHQQHRHRWLQHALLWARFPHRMENRELQVQVQLVLQCRLRAVSTSGAQVQLKRLTTCSKQAHNHHLFSLPNAKI